MSNDYQINESTNPSAAICGREKLPNHERLDNAIRNMAGLEIAAQSLKDRIRGHTPTEDEGLEKAPIPPTPSLWEVLETSGDRIRASQEVTAKILNEIEVALFGE